MYMLCELVTEEHWLGMLHMSETDGRCICILMGLLNKVNAMFMEKEDIARINEKASNSFEAQYKKTSYYMGRV